jgi:hypothetical protein
LITPRQLPESWDILGKFHHNPLQAKKVLTRRLIAFRQIAVGNRAKVSSVVRSNTGK